MRIGKVTDVKGPSNFYPVHTQGHHLQTFIDMVQNDFRKLDRNKKYKNPLQNLNKQEKQALKTLIKMRIWLLGRPIKEGGGGSGPEPFE